ncbi:MAG: 1-acyl-sn-glycerol-3-phosphate acyltransferase [Smithella sp.]|nr:1-acyl-sn-glycerol-3-phosphate acyltransferase [Smithella sp.]
MDFRVNKKPAAKSNNTVKKPLPLLYYPVGFFVTIYFKHAFKHKVDKKALRGIKPPYLVVANHSCWLDYMISASSMYPVRMNYVGAYNFFRDKVLRRVFTWMGVISKNQFTNDLSSIKKMKYVIQRGGVVAIYPHGYLSNDGRPGGFAVFGIAKLVRFLNVPVVAIHTNGGYLTRPRWTKRARYGKLETTVRPILTVDQIRELSEEQIYHVVTGALDFDDHAWQRERMVPFRGKNLAEGVEYVLYKCPKCFGEFTLRSEGDRLYCSECDNSVRMNKYLLLEPEHQDTVHFSGIDKWFDFQRDHLQKEIESPDFQLSASTKLLCAEPNKYGYQHLGNGVVILTRESITYIGSAGDEDTTLSFPMKNILMIPYAAGEYIEVAKESDVSRFVFDDLRQQIKWVMAVRQIRDKYYEKISQIRPDSIATDTANA